MWILSRIERRGSVKSPLGGAICSEHPGTWRWAPWRGLAEGHAEFEGLVAKRERGQQLGQMELKLLESNLVCVIILLFSSWASPTGGKGWCPGTLLWNSSQWEAEPQECGMGLMKSSWIYKGHRFVKKSWALWVPTTSLSDRRLCSPFHGAPTPSRKGAAELWNSSYCICR